MDLHAPTHRLLHDIIFISFPGHVLSSEHGHQIPWKSQVTELFGRQPLGAQNRWLRAPYVPGKASEDVSFGARVLQRCVVTITTDYRKKNPKKLKNKCWASKANERLEKHVWLFCLEMYAARCTLHLKPRSSALNQSVNMCQSFCLDKHWCYCLCLLLRKGRQFLSLHYQLFTEAEVKSGGQCSPLSPTPRWIIVLVYVT